MPAHHHRPALPPARPCLRRPGGAVDGSPASGGDEQDGVGLAELVGRVPAGWTEVRYGGRRWGLTRTDHAHGGTTTLYAEQLDGTSAVSANVWHTSGGDVLRPCEMPAQEVLDFLRGWTAGTRSDGEV